MASLPKTGDRDHLVIITPTTHWDREWVQPQIQFQIRLVNLIDHLLDILERDAQFTCFLFDGQTVPFEDYLEIRPQNRERLRLLVSQKRIVVGPWYVLADQFLEDGESTIRNLITGRQQSKALGAEPLAVCYVPDSFGSMDTLPMFAAGFDLPYVMFGRGRPEDLPTDKVCFTWIAADGSQALAANHGYGSGLFLSYPDIWTDIQQALPNGPDAAKTMAASLNDLMPRENTQCFYFSVGVDHMEPRPSLPDIVACLKEAIQGYDFRIASPLEYMQAVSGAKPDLVTYQGEMRGPDLKAFNGCNSTRIYLKQANFRAQRWLSRYVEPLASLAYLVNGDYPAQFINYAWRLLLRNHPHDSICGTSPDWAHADMANRYKRVEEASAMLAENAAHAFASVLDTRHARTEAVPVVVVNTLANPRTDVVKQAVRIPRRFNPEQIVVLDGDGRALPGRAQVRALKNKDLESLPMTVEQLGMVHSKNASPDRAAEDVFSVVDVEFLAPKVPGPGWRTFWLAPGQAQGEAGVQLIPGGMQNDFLKVTFNPNGTFELADRRSGHVFQNEHYFEDGEDIGDAYGFHHFTQPDVRTTLNLAAEITAAVVLPYKITYQVKLGWKLPDSSKATRRSGRLRRFDITSEITLYAGIDRVEVTTHYDNTCRDHRLQVVFDSGLNAEFSTAEGNFGLSRRPVLSSGEGMEAYPQQAFVDVSDGSLGLEVCNRGLPEFEAARTPDGARIYLTLLRSVGRLGAPAGADHPAPGAYCLGSQTAEYALRPHVGDVYAGGCAAAAHQYAAPLWCAGGLQHPGSLPSSGALAQPGAGMALTALKKAEDGPELIMRLWNTTPQDKTITLGGLFPILKGWITDMKEENRAECTVATGNLTCAAKHDSVLTLVMEVDNGI